LKVAKEDLGKVIGKSGGGLPTASVPF
jgi:predicted RNA-binding protein YlqC (UPF0109 family)